jgi:hypothetical protein
MLIPLLYGGVKAATCFTNKISYLLNVARGLGRTGLVPLAHFGDLADPDLLG